ncbi:MAG TPA: Smr/MutS family protein, partial [Myxococcaceae bacterium]|nr:Smr/MutS family protein [Myxococcaceae bacterium]
MHFSPRTLEDLAFPEVLAALGQRCRTVAGRTRALARSFLDDASAIREALGRVDEARALLQAQVSLPLGGVADIRGSVERAEKGGLLEPRELTACAQTLFAFTRTREALAERSGMAPRLAFVGQRLPDLEKLAARIDRCFEADGEVSERASPALKEARDRIRGLHRAIKSRLDTLLHDEKFLLNLREGYYTLRNNRYVVPVLAQARAEVPGIVHNASQSGQTLFVEPETLVGIGNDLAIAQSVALEEERRVLQELSDAVGRESARLLEGVDAAAELDEAEAAAQLGADLGAATPVVEDPDGPLVLLDLRHPLLVLRGREVVANDVRLDGEVRALVVSGPNAGGKTVTLTAVGLCAVLLRAGLQVPASAGSRVPLFTSVHSAVGDAQDIAQDLSTFSAHVQELKRILEGAGPGGLALIDEIAADTDPREGAALAIAVLEELIGRGVRVLVTTHLEELKALTHVDPRFLNARVGFDSRRMAPTYKLQLGAAGTSSALDLASRMGLAPRVVDRARELARSSGGPLAQALAAAEEERRSLASELERARTATAESEASATALAAERAAFAEQRRAEESSHAERLRIESERALAEVSAQLAELRQQATVERAEAARAVLAAQAEAARARAEALSRESARATLTPAPDSLRIGDVVHHVGLRRDVTVLELAGEEVLVSAGALKMRVPRSELAGARDGRPASRFPSSDRGRTSLARATDAAPRALEAPALRVDVRGLRADEAVREVESFLDQAFRNGDPGVLVLHGHGTGALKQAVRDYLEDSPYVRMYRPGESHEGGDG